jgi:hypothetical protein
MRNGQNKRMRGRNNSGGGRKSQNPLTRLYESNGPDVKIRGTASHIAEKYIQLARDSHGSGDPVAAENYYQHAEHYFRMIAAAQDQFRQGQPQQPPSYRPDGSTDSREESFDDEADDHQGHPMMGGSEPSYGNREPQQRDGQPYPSRDGQQHQHRDQQPPYGRDPQSYHPRDQHQPRPNQPSGGTDATAQADVSALPSFITGGGQPQPSFQQPHSQNGHDGQPDRFPLHRRRRRHRGPRGDMPGGARDGSQGGEDLTPGPRPTND